MNKIKDYIDRDYIKVVTGVRRSGKSYFFNMIIEELIKRGIKEENILLIDFELPSYNYINTRRELDDIVLDFLKDKKEKVYLLFDEIQKIEDWEKSITGYYKLPNTDVYITGSNSKLLSNELSTLLTGRYVSINMYPFSFNEFLEYKKELNDECIIKREENSEIENLFEEYLEYGGLPQVIATRNNKTTPLRDLFSSIIYNDLIERFNIRNNGLFKRTIKFLLENIGNLISGNSIFNYLHHDNKKMNKNTVYNYLDYLELGYLFLKVTREDLVGKKEINGSKKYYVIDQGFYKSELEDKQRNIGKLLENMVYINLLRNGYKVTIGSVGEYEVDFKAKKDNKISYFQVTYQLNDEKTIEREFNSLIKIKDNYPKYVLSMDKFDFSRDGIKHVNIINFMRNFK